MQQIAVSGRDQIRDTKEITMAWPCFETQRTSAWNNEGRMRGKPTRERIKKLDLAEVAVLHSNGQLRTERDGHERSSVPAHP